MKTLKIKVLNICILYFLAVSSSHSQSELQSNDTITSFTNISEALKSPEKVMRLDLSNKEVGFLPDSIWNKFTNLEFLSLKNDHLSRIPDEIGYLERLRILDLSGNDFFVLPSTFSKLDNLYELYLNDEINMNVDQSLQIIQNLPNLRILHLENDHLDTLPKSVMHFKNLEALYLNNNEFTKLPKNLDKLKKLKFVDLKDNKYNLQGMDNQAFGYKMRF